MRFLKHHRMWIIFSSQLSCRLLYFVVLSFLLFSLICLFFFLTFCVCYVADATIVEYILHTFAG